MIDICVVTGWVTRLGGVLIPEVMALYPANWVDDVGNDAREIMPDPNVTICRGYVTQAQSDALEADARVIVLWSREVVTA